MEDTRKCPVCEKPYKVYPHYVGDQSACPQCRGEAEELNRKFQQVPRPWK